MLTEAQKVEIRRHLGFPVAGNPINSPIGRTGQNAGFQGYRFFQVYGRLEWRMSWLQPVEESKVTGLYSLAVSVIQTTQPATPIEDGEVQLTVVAGGANEIITVQPVVGDTVFTVAIKLADGINANQNLASARVTAASPMNVGPFSEAAKPPAIVNPLPAVQLTSPEAFSVSFATISPMILIAPGGLDSEPPTPITTIDGIEYRGYLAILTKLEGMLATTAENLDTEKADVWTARKDEIEVRTKLYNIWRSKLAAFFDIPLYEDTGYGVMNRRAGGKLRVA